MRERKPRTTTTRLAVAMLRDGTLQAVMIQWLLQNLTGKQQPFLRLRSFSRRQFIKKHFFISSMLENCVQDEDEAYEQMTFKEYIDPFTGRKNT